MGEDGYPTFCTYTETIGNNMCSKNEHIGLTGASDADYPKSTAHIMIVFPSICAECTPHLPPKALGTQQIQSLRMVLVFGGDFPRFYFIFF